VVLEPLLHAASTLTPSTTAVPAAILVPVNRGWTRLTPSSSFLLDHASSAGYHRDASVLVITFAGYTCRNRLLPGEWREMDPYPGPDDRQSISRAAIPSSRQYRRKSLS
jgi:hypothetical protein